MTNEDFAQLFLQQLPAEFHFAPVVTYDPDGDCIEFIAAPDSFYAERIDTLVTVYRSQETDEIVGSLIKGVAKFLRAVLERVPGFRIEIQDGRMRLTHLFTAKLWSEPIDPKALPSRTYQKLRSVAEQTGAEVDVGGMALV